MLSQKHRLRREQDIKRVLRTGKRIRTSLATFTVAETKNGQDARVGVVVGKQVHISAAVRHRVQRLLREVAREVIEKHPSGYDMVVVAHSPAANIRAKAGFKDLYEHIITALSKHLSQ